MQQIFQLFWQIALLRRSPEDIPQSTFLLTAAGGFYLFVNVVTMLLTGANQPTLLLIFADLLLLVVWAFALLASFGKQARITQTLTALLGTGSLLQLISLPLSLAAGQGLTWLTNLSVLAFLFILLWAVTAYGFIVARAVDISAGIGVFFASIYFLLNFQLAAFLLPST
jgi:hypothetical protein